MEQNEIPTHERVLEVFAGILSAGRKCADTLQEKPGTEAAARAFKGLEAARDALQRATTP